MWFDGELFERLGRWDRAGVRVALASIIAIEGSAPRPVGSVIAIAENGELYGALSNGCVEAEIVTEAQSVLRDGIAKVLKYGIGDGIAQPGLLCGGEITVLLERLSPDSSSAVQQRFSPPPHIVLLGAGDITEALAVFARFLGYVVTLVDPRTEYRSRYADASHYDSIVDAWPETVIAEMPLNADSALVSFFHEQRFEIAAITYALTNSEAYVGALGSRRVQRERAAVLRERGITPAQLERLHAPVGLNIGANSPKEIALSIMAEIIAVRSGRDGTSLKLGDGPIMSAHANPTACPNR